MNRRQLFIGIGAAAIAGPAAAAAAPAIGGAVFGLDSAGVAPDLSAWVTYRAYPRLLREVYTQDGLCWQQFMYGDGVAPPLGILDDELRRAT